MHKPTDDEAFVLEYLNEIEKLKCDGYWSNRVVDFLPLALANFEKMCVIIYTNKVNQPTIKICPTIGETNSDHVINLAYILVPSVIEHYDACENITSDNNQAEDEINCANPHDSGENMLYATRLPDTVINMTPRKSAKFVSPVKKRLTRKRKTTPENWKRNVRKRLKLSGKEYTSAKGKTVSEKKLQSCDCSKCKFKCDRTFTEEQRTDIFESFWSLMSYERQKDFVCSRVEEKGTKSYINEDGEKKQKMKQVHRKYTFQLNEESIQVCKNFFLATLSIGEAYVYHALEKKSHGHFQGHERRGKQKSVNKIDDEAINSVKAHINSFPRVSGHYTRRDSKKSTLDLT